MLEVRQCLRHTPVYGWKRGMRGGKDTFHVSDQQNETVGLARKIRVIKDIQRIVTTLLIDFAQLYHICTILNSKSPSIPSIFEYLTHF